MIIEVVNLTQTNTLHLFQEPCITTNEGPQKNKTCIFPFKFTGPEGGFTQYERCIMSIKDDGKYWCPTEGWNGDKNGWNGQTWNGDVNWGFCPQTCPRHTVGCIIVSI